MADSTLVALKGVMARLQGFAALTALVDSGNIVTNASQQISFPYVVVELDSQPWKQDDGSHMEHTITVHSFSNLSTPAEAMQIGQEVFNALDRQGANIVLDSGNVVLCDFSGLRTTIRETNGSTWHNVTEFKLTID